MNKTGMDLILKSYFMSKGYTIRSVIVKQQLEDKKLIILELESKNYLENKHVFRVVFRSYSDYETGSVQFMNNIGEQYLLENITIPKNGTLNHTVGAFNVPLYRALKSIEIQTELTIIAVEFSTFIINNV